MTLIVDAGALYAQADADEPRHAAVAAILRSSSSASNSRTWRRPGR
jgi:hypothetical protein